MIDRFYRAGVLSDSGTWNAAIAIFDALSKHSRLATYSRLLAAGEEGVDTRALVQEFGTTAGAMALHLRRLADAGLVRPHRHVRGRFVAERRPLIEIVRLLDGDSG
jgi:DNA-binding transcriptional ArsR family regulator